MARHLVAAGSLVDDDPERALEHARYARSRASRIAVVREAAGIAAYHAGEWAEALGEFRAARRMGGGPGHLAVMADIERALGRPERALELARSPEVRELDRAETVELAIVAAGARRDLGELDVAVVGLQLPELNPELREPWSARLFYAYADNLLAAGRESDALQWFVHTVDADPDGITDADLRIAELTGEPLPEDDVIGFDVEEVEDVEDVAELDEGEDSTEPDDGADPTESHEGEIAAASDDVKDSAVSAEVADGADSAEVADPTESGGSESSTESGGVDERAESAEVEDPPDSEDFRDSTGSGDVKDSADSGEIEDSRLDSGDDEDRTDSGDVEDRTDSGEVEDRTASGKLEDSTDSDELQDSVKPDATDDHNHEVVAPDELTVVPTASGPDR